MKKPKKKSKPTRIINKELEKLYPEWVRSKDYEYLPPTEGRDKNEKASLPNV